jgi:hypothetical protein
MNNNPKLKARRIATDLSPFDQYAAGEFCAPKLKSALIPLKLTFRCSAVFDDEYCGVRQCHHVSHAWCLSQCRAIEQHSVKIATQSADPTLLIDRLAVLEEFNLISVRRRPNPCVRRATGHECRLVGNFHWVHCEGRSNRYYDDAFTACGQFSRDPIANLSDIIAGAAAADRHDGRDGKEPPDEMAIFARRERTLNGRRRLLGTRRQGIHTRPTE